MTLADVTLVVALITPLQTVLDQQFRKDTLPNLSRYCQIMLEGKAFLQTFGRIHFAKKPLQINFPKIEQVQKQAQPVKQAAP